jgi:hypothetical protein
MIELGVYIVDFGKAGNDNSEEFYNKNPREQNQKVALVVPGVFLLCLQMRAGVMDRYSELEKVCLRVERRWDPSLVPSFPDLVSLLNKLYCERR